MIGQTSIWRFETCKSVFDVFTRGSDVIIFSDVKDDEFAPESTRYIKALHLSDCTVNKFSYSEYINDVRPRLLLTHQSKYMYGDIY